jgi:hypothetical protein
MPPQSPHDPLAHMLPVIEPHTWPGAVQRLTPLDSGERTQQPPPAQLLFVQQG